MLRCATCRSTCCFFVKDRNAQPGAHRTRYTFRNYYRAVFNRAPIACGPIITLVTYTVTLLLNSARRPARFAACPNDRAYHEDICKRIFPRLEEAARLNSIYCIGGHRRSCRHDFHVNHHSDKQWVHSPDHERLRSGPIPMASSRSRFSLLCRHTDHY